LVYFGPVHSTEEKDGPKDFRGVLGYFESLGITCPEHKNPADFILDVSNGLAHGSENLNAKEAYRVRILLPLPPKPTPQYNIQSNGFLISFV